MEVKKDKYVFYEGKSHFIYKDSPIPLIMSDRFSIEVGLESDWMFTNPDRETKLLQQYFLKFSDIDILVYYWQLEPYQMEAVWQQKKTQGLAFPIK